jgi:SAM-dependent methyltransferase
VASLPPDPISLGALGRVGDRGALEHYADPAYYAKTYGPRRIDVDYYVRLARLAGGPVLEYGVGNGRIAIPMARAGVPVVGVDLSRPMLDDLHQRLALERPEVRARVRPMHGDMRAARLRRRFPLVIAPFNAILHLYDVADVLAFFARVRTHLAPGGQFVFDYSIPRAADLARSPDQRFGAPRLRHPATGQLVRYAERFEYDPLRQLLLIRIEFSPEDGSAPWTVALTHRQFYPQEMRILLQAGGLHRIELSADFTDEPPGPEVDSLVVTCQARVARRPRRP